MTLVSLDRLQSRLAHYYLGRLRFADRTYKRGDSTAGLTVFDQEWSQMKQAWAWSAAHVERNHEAARLCAAYAALGEDMLILRQTPQERIEWLTHGLAAARAIGDRRTEMICLFRMGWAIHKLSDLERAEAVTVEALAVATALHDTLYQARSTHLLGELAIRRGAYAQAEQYHQQSLRGLQAVNAPVHMAEVYFSLGELAMTRGEFSAALAYGEQCAAIQDTLGLIATSNNEGMVAYLLWANGDFKAGEARARGYVAACRAMGTHATLAYALYTLGQFALGDKRYTEALACFEEGTRIATTINETWLIPTIAYDRGQLYLRSGNLHAARREFEAVEAESRRTGYQISLALALMALAETDIALGVPERAAPRLAEGMRFAVNGHRYDQTPGVFVAAQLWAAQGQPETAAAWLALLRATPLDPLLRTHVDTFYTSLSTTLAPDLFDAATANGLRLEWDSVLAYILRELGAA